MTDLLSRLEGTESLLAAERASNQALYHELQSLRSERGVGSAAAEDSRDEASPPPHHHHEHINNNNSISVSATAAAAAAEGEHDERLLRRRRRGGRGDDERPRPPWQNVLYKRQPYADNHVPDSFLEKLVTNGGLAQ